MRTGQGLGEHSCLGLVSVIHGSDSKTALQPSFMGSKKPKGPRQRPGVHQAAEEGQCSCVLGGGDGMAQEGRERNQRQVELMYTPGSFEGPQV